MQWALMKHWPRILTHRFGFLWFYIIRFKNENYTAFFICQIYFTNNFPQDWGRDVALKLAYYIWGGGAHMQREVEFDDPRHAVWVVKMPRILLKPNEFSDKI